MTQVPPITVHIREYAQALKTHWKWWVIPTATLSVAALAFALVKPNTWEATQVLHVRNEAAGTVSRPGQFESVDAMKTAQETLLELARNQNALAAALREVGPPPDRRSTTPFPSPDDVDALRDAITIKAPGGAEFGRTEVLHVSVKSRDKARAVVLAAAVCDQLERNLQLLRDRRTSSVIEELTGSLQLAQIDLKAATNKLQDLEGEVGGDLHELRLLNQSGTGESNLRTSLSQIKNELRAAKAAYEDKQEQLKFLESATGDVKQVVAMPNRLLESQPSLKRLKDGLVDAQLRTAELSGTMSKDHPKVQAALSAEAAVLSDLRSELVVATRGLHADLAISGALVQSLENQQQQAERRLDRLAALRTRYGALEAEVKQRTDIVQKATQELADARANHAAASAASLITRIDGPQLGSRPLGPGRSMICIAGVMGGLCMGMGLVFLVSPQGQAAGRRWSDSVATLGRRATDLIPGFGRRRSDQPGGQRLGDPPAGIPGGRRAIDPPAAPTPPSDAIPGGRRTGDPVANPASASRERRTGEDRRKSS